MQKRTFITLLILIIFLGVVGFFLVVNRNSIPRVEVEETMQPGFTPFSGTNLGGEDLSIQEQGQDPSVSGLPNFQTITDSNTVDSNLEQISDQPVAGYTLFSKTFEIVEDPRELINDSLVETYNFFDYENLRIGDTGEGVTALKVVLNRIYSDAGLSPEGGFDTATKNTLIRFQTDNKLPADGIVGSGTKAKLNEVQGLSRNPQDFEPIVRQEERVTVRYQNKSNGFIYDLGVDDRSFQEISRVTFSAIHESFFANNGANLVIRYLSDQDSITTYLANIVELENGSTTLEGKFLAPDIPFVSVSSDGARMVYFEKNNRRTRGFVHDFKTGEKKTVFESKFSEWLPQFNGPEIFTLTTRASALALGYSYRYNANEKDVFTRGIGGFSGLTTNYNPSGSKVLYSTNNGGRFIETYVFDFNDNSTLRLGISTLAEKCVWTDNDNLLCAVPRFIGPEDYPDAWYKGEVLFDDRLWSINTQNGVERIVSNLRHPAVQAVDLVSPVYKDNVLLFQNKHDYTLWMLDMRNN